MYLDFFVILNDTDRARERAIKYGEIKYGEREQSNIEIKYGEREIEIEIEKRATPLAVLCMACKL